MLPHYPALPLRTLANTWQEIWSLLFLSGCAYTFPTRTKIIKKLKKSLFVVCRFDYLLTTFLTALTNKKYFVHERDE